MGQSYLPVIDFFAGPGGLGEGFSSYRSSTDAPFRLALSIEKDRAAHATLLLRSFKRQFTRVPETYYDRLRGAITTQALYSAYPAQSNAAHAEAIRLELGRGTRARTDCLVTAALGSRPDGPWVLVGGPPCQAYSLMGRSKLRGENPDAYERDGRHFLYREYLRILRHFQPPIFVMENVKGLLSSTAKGRETFRIMLRDLRSAGYTLHSFTRLGISGEDLDPNDFVIRSEDYGIPQCRHRVIILGLRNGIERGRSLLQPQLLRPGIEEAIGDLPRIRSGLTDAPQDYDAWRRAIRETATLKLGAAERSIAAQMLRRQPPTAMGAEFLESTPGPARMSPWLKANAEWFLDDRIGGVLQHSGRRHMKTDIQRYFFATIFSAARGRSPKIADFPRALLPAHRNVAAAVKGKKFSDRFRVQIAGRPSTTVMSHISKDGHYYIHYDPLQCRSLTVREAARLQTFPDNYYFEGGQTDRYQQVGNAVPPLLARELARVVADIADQLRPRVRASKRAVVAVQ